MCNGIYYFIGTEWGCLSCLIYYILYINKKCVQVSISFIQKLI